MYVVRERHGSSSMAAHIIVTLLRHEPNFTFLPHLLMETAINLHTHIDCFFFFFAFILLIVAAIAAAVVSYGMEMVQQRADHISEKEKKPKYTIDMHCALGIGDFVPAPDIIGTYLFYLFNYPTRIKQTYTHTKKI